MKKLLLIITAFIIFLPFNTSLAFFTDIESSNGGTFSAGTLSFNIIPDTHSSGISDVFSPSFGFTIQNTGTENPQYKITATTTSSECSVSDFYNELDITLSGPNSISYTGSLDSLNFTGYFTGSWGMTVGISNDFSAYIGEACEFTFIVEAWQQNIVYGDGGFTDTNTVTFNLTSLAAIGQQVTTSIVLNEIYPNKISTTTLLLDQEWVELYNGTDNPIDIEGWQIGELTSGVGAEVKHTVSSVNTCASGFKVGYARPYNGASTVVPAGGLLIVELCASGRMYNNGDTITLYNAASTTLDSHTYPDTQAGKSHARIPDGGTWVDPIPSPGISNMETITVDDLLKEGWSDEVIKSVLGSEDDGLLNVENTQNTEPEESTEEDLPTPSAPDGTI